MPRFPLFMSELSRALETPRNARLVAEALKHAASISDEAARWAHELGADPRSDEEALRLYIELHSRLLHDIAHGNAAASTRATETAFA